MPSNDISKHGEFWISFEFKFEFIYSHLINYNTTTKEAKVKIRQKYKKIYERTVKEVLFEWPHD